MAESRLFKPLKIGNMQLQHRIGMCPLTRLRATDDRVPTPMMKEYYGQRAAVPGTFILAEGTIACPAAGGNFPNAPGMWSEEQVAGWKAITDEVHSKGSYIFCQLFGAGRVASEELAKAEGIKVIGPSATPLDQDSPVPHAMTIAEIEEMVRDFGTAARNAIRAGFDGVECHGANGYIIDQFNQDMSNQRQDKYGGSVENRSRFIAEIMKAMVDAVGSERVGLRLSPWSPFQGMKMADPIPQFKDIIDKASKLNLAYLSVVESRVSGSGDHEGSESLDFVYDSWKGPLLVAGGYTPARATALVDESHPDRDIVVLFGRHFVSNPDLVFRVQKGLKLSPYNRDTFYVNKSPIGYVDYPHSPEYLLTQTTPATS
jgi:NADPH2 dehydrogenase